MSHWACGGYGGGGKAGVLIWGALSMYYCTMKLLVPLVFLAIVLHSCSSGNAANSSHVIDVPSQLDSLDLLVNRSRYGMYSIDRECTHSRFALTEIHPSER